YTASMRTPTALPSGASTSHTCMASSRVGTSTSEVGEPGSAFTVRCSNGRPKAKVFPDPVLALPQTSRPAIASGMVWAWIGKGSVIPAEVRASTRRWSTPREAKVGTLAPELRTGGRAVRLLRRARPEVRSRLPGLTLRHRIRSRRVQGVQGRSGLLHVEPHL